MSMRLIFPVVGKFAKMLASRFHVDIVCFGRAVEFSEADLMIVYRHRGSPLAQPAATHAPVARLVVPIETPVCVVVRAIRRTKVFDTIVQGIPVLMVYFQEPFAAMDRPDDRVSANPHPVDRHVDPLVSAS